MALALICEPASYSLAQRLSVEAGGGFGMSTTSAHNYILHGYLSVQRALSDQFDVGIDLSADLNNDRVCVTACTLEFPDIGDLVMPVSLRLSRLSVGFGPGVFYLHGSGPGHLYVGRVAAHADVTLMRMGASAVIASIRPLLALGGARSVGDWIGIVPVTVGLRW
jgi:hypothetical protein